MNVQTLKHPSWQAAMELVGAALPGEAPWYQSGGP